jgi:hypothetical protein
MMNDELKRKRQRRRVAPDFSIDNPVAVSSLNSSFSLHRASLSPDL